MREFLSTLLLYDIFFPCGFAFLLLAAKSRLWGPSGRNRASRGEVMRNVDT